MASPDAGMMLVSLKPLAQIQRRRGAIKSPDRCTRMHIVTGTRLATDTGGWYSRPIINATGEDGMIVTRMRLSPVWTVRHS